MFKHRFLALKDGVKLPHEDESTALCFACLMLHKKGLGDGNFEDSVFPQDEPKKTAEVTTKSKFG